MPSRRRIVWSSALCTQNGGLLEGCETSTTVPGEPGCPIHPRRPLPALSGVASPSRVVTETIFAPCFCYPTVYHGASRSMEEGETGDSQVNCRPTRAPATFQVGLSQAECATRFICALAVMYALGPTWPWCMPFASHQGSRCG